MPAQVTRNHRESIRSLNVVLGNDRVRSVLGSAGAPAGNKRRGHPSDAGQNQVVLVHAEVLPLSKPSLKIEATSMFRKLMCPV